MRLNQISDNPKARSARKRVGRGIGSGLGKTAGRGNKGQNARAGAAMKDFEGGQMPLHRRLPKRGFKNPARRRFAELNLGRLQAAIDAGRLDPKAPIDAAALVLAGLVARERDGVRLLAKGELKAKVSLTVAGASRAAAAAVERAGGSLTVTAPAPPAAEVPAEASEGG